MGTLINLKRNFWVIVDCTMAIQGYRRSGKKRNRASGISPLTESREDSGGHNSDGLGIPYVNFVLTLVSTIMVGMDNESRALDDRVCDTRVIRTASLAQI